MSSASSHRLPDAMPDIEKPTLLVVCDTHHCRLIDVGGHSIVEKETLKSKEAEFSDRQDMHQSPAAFGKGGMLSGSDDLNQFEKNRMKNFANELVKQLGLVIAEQKIRALYFSAPAKFLSVFRGHQTPGIKKILVQELKGNFVKEAALDILTRFRPDLMESVKDIRDQESYSPKKQPPKK